MKKHPDLIFNFFILSIGVIAFFGIIFIKKNTITQIFTDPIVYFYAIFVSVFRLSRLTGALFSKRSFAKLISPVADNYEPTVTFIIPCKNEEKSIKKTVSKCFEVDYPKEKIEVIVINDGSTDNTINILNFLKEKYPNLMIVDWKKNKGKRCGMAAGFRMAKGEIVVQLDSDSYINPKTFRNLVKPFSNSTIGGYVQMPIPKMLIKIG